MAPTQIMQPEDISRSMERLAYEVMERHGDCQKLAIVGIQRRGADLAQRLRAVLETRLGHRVQYGALDINLYRDDWTSLSGKPAIAPTTMPIDCDGAEVLLVDDVLFSGRTIRAALEALNDYGRPQRVELLVLVDRGHRELPIHADYVGRTINTSRVEHVDVFLAERDGKEGVFLSK